MNTFLSIFAVTLIGSGMVVWFTCAILLRVRAFKESLGWGLTCLFLPLGILLFVVRFWNEKKRLFFTQIAGAALMVTGYSVVFGLSDTPAFVNNIVGRSYDRREDSRKKQEELKKRDLERAMNLKAEAQERAKELYGYVQNWQLELQAKRPGPNASASEVEAFNREYANYSGLAEYKEAVKALSEPAPAR